MCYSTNIPIIEQEQGIPEIRNTVHTRMMMIWGIFIRYLI